jgi:Zn-dependent protease with chaperone function
MEYSADRAGLVACGDLESAVSTMIKLGSGSHVTPDQVKGAIDGRYQIDGDRDLIGAILSTHPDLDDRVKELVRFGRS